MKPPKWLSKSLHRDSERNRLSFNLADTPPLDTLRIFVAEGTSTESQKRSYVTLVAMSGQVRLRAKISGLDSVPIGEAISTALLRDVGRKVIDETLLAEALARERIKQPDVELGDVTPEISASVEYGAAAADRKWVEALASTEKDSLPLRSANSSLFEALKVGVLLSDSAVVERRQELPSTFNNA